ncbi:hypothetical protein K474DRAFT_1124502 [Panus rudis PR-1116 ss-1]|nr:hypothetical protein K474DRAFT_1124502 [Panus rudis PR-1116 ss-1]
MAMPRSPAGSQQSNTTSNRPLTRGKGTVPRSMGTEPEVTDFDSALKFLHRQELVPTSETQRTVATLSTGLLHLADKTKEKAIAEGIRAFSFYAQEMFLEDITEKVKERMAGPLRSLMCSADTVGDLVQKYEDLSAVELQTAVSLKESNAELKEQIGELNRTVKIVVEKTSDQTAKLDAVVERTTTAAEKVTAAPLGGTPSGFSYAQAVSRGGPPPPKATIQKGKMRAKCIIVDAEQLKKGARAAPQNEKELLAKAALAIDILREDYRSACRALEADDGGAAGYAPPPEGDISALDIPEKLTFVSAKWLRNGGVEYELNEPENAQWLAQPDVQKHFLSKMGLSDKEAIIRAQTFRLVLPYVPLTFHPDSHLELQMVESASGLSYGDIVKASWIKNPNRRNAQQRSAFAFFDFRSEIAAKLAQDEGLLIEGKHIFGRKPDIEPYRCNKCQLLASHMAAQCKQIHDTCGTCGGIDHRTSECGVKDKVKYYCTNCRKSGHASWDRMCPTLLAKRKEMLAKRPDAMLKYYPMDDPSTWERIDQDVTQDSALLGQAPSAGKSTPFEREQDHGWEQVRRNRRSLSRAPSPPNDEVNPVSSSVNTRRSSYHFE